VGDFADALSFPGPDLDDLSALAAIHREGFRHLPARRLGPTTTSSPLRWPLPNNPSRGDGAPIYIDARHLRDRAFDRRQALAKIFVDGGAE
jgi:hypothetical protein